MNYDIVEARHVAGHIVWLRFRDGTSGEIDLAPALRRVAHTLSLMYGPHARNGLPLSLL